MSYVFITIGALMCILAVKQDDSIKQFATLFAADMGGSDGFIWWLAAIAVIGGIGYLPDMGGASTAFLVLILIAFVLKNGGVFDKIKEAL